MPCIRPNCARASSIRKTKEYRYTVRRKSSPGLKVSILGPVGPVGSLGPGGRKIQISQATQAKARIPGKFFCLPG